MGILASSIGSTPADQIIVTVERLAAPKLELQKAKASSMASHLCFGNLNIDDTTTPVVEAALSTKT